MSKARNTKKNESSSSQEPKTKLRTAADVINRLKWPQDDTNESTPTVQNTVMGYDCRINGPMEKCVADYTSINDGGDFPEHRIQYFRKVGITNFNSLVLWDRVGRVDRLFGSGSGSKAPIAPETLSNIAVAIANMKRLAEEQKIKAQEKAKKKARARAKKAAAAASAAAAAASTANAAGISTIPGGQATTTTSSTTGTSTTTGQDRHTWEALNSFYIYSSKTHCWTQGGGGVAATKRSKSPPNKGRTTNHDVKVVTWNVLFDLKFVVDENNNTAKLVEGEECCGLVDDETDSSPRRWQVLLDCLSQTKAEIIALQEVTPRFVSVLQEQPWVQDAYALTACNDHLETLAPYGNLLLWRRDLYRPIGVHSCSDLHRKRATIVSLLHKQDRTVLFNVANVHLPSDAKGGVDRTTARKRELSAIMAKLQTLEEQQLTEQKTLKSVPLVLGDFNTDEEIITNEFFSDAWCQGTSSNASGEVGNEDEQHAAAAGLTYDYIRNERAAKNREDSGSTKAPRRIDRVYIGKGLGTASVVGQTPRRLPLLQAVKAELIGVTSDTNDPSWTPPSDHFGVCVSLEIASSEKRTTVASRTLHHPQQVGQNAWARGANPTTETILALIMDRPFDGLNNGGPTLYDRTSTLPVPHITLLNGFVEISSKESQYLATQAVEEAVIHSLGDDSDDDPSHRHSWNLPLNSKSLSVFEHRGSASLVGIPDVTRDEGQWLNHLYQTLRAIFPNCHEQESRFSDGWTPHFSMGSYGTAAAAREAANEALTSGAWPKEVDDTLFIQAGAVGIYRRNLTDGKFYSVASVPLVPEPGRHKEILPRETSAFLKDAGKSWSSYINGISLPVLWEIERACEHVIQDQTPSGQAKIKAQLLIYGSHALGASLPGISDLDALLKLTPDGTKSSTNPVQSISSSKFFQGVLQRLQSLYPTVKGRLRVAGAAGVAVHVLTIKLPSQAPSLDLMLCRCDGGGTPLDVSSQVALDAVDDFEAIRDHVTTTSQSLLPNCEFTFWDVFQGALRIIKLWAVRRQVYGAPVGFLGGGGWATFLARVVCDGLKSSDLSIPPLTYESIGTAASFVASYFLKTASSFWPRPMVVTLEGGRDVNNANTTARDRETMTVVSVAGGNYGRYSTRSTTQATLDELHRAATILKQDDGSEKLEEVLAPAALEHILTESCSLVLLAVSPAKTASGSSDMVPPPPRPSEIKGWAAGQALALTVKLERVIGEASQIRPLSKPLRVNGVFYYVIRVSQCGPDREWKEIVQKQEPQLEADRVLSFPNLDARILTLSVQETLELLN